MDNTISCEKLFRLDGRVALVTGAAGHLGTAISRVLCDAGAHVILNGRTRGTIESLSAELKGRGHAVSTAILDITDERELGKLFERINAEHGRLDVIVNNAYSGKTGTIESATTDEFEDAYRITVAAAFNIIKKGIPLLEKAARQTRGGASVINIATMYGVVSPDPSLYGDSGFDNPPYYGAAKAGLIQLTRYSACHLAEQRIRVNSISPGPFPGPGLKNTQPDFYHELCRKIPLKRVGKADELCGAVLFLAADAASYVTGINMPVDGGWTAW